MTRLPSSLSFFFFNDTATTEIYTLSLHDALPLLNERRSGRSDRSADFAALARWFAEAPDDAAAHRLWRAALGPSPPPPPSLTRAHPGERGKMRPPAAGGGAPPPPLFPPPQQTR